MSRAATRRRRARLALLLVGLPAALLAIYAAVVALWLPRELAHRLPEALQRHGMSLAYGRLSIHPFRLTLDAGDVTLVAPAAGLVIEAQRLHGRLAWHSLLARRWQVSGLAVEGARAEWTQRALTDDARPPPAAPKTATRQGYAASLPPVDIARLTLALDTLTLRGAAPAEPLTLRGGRAEVLELSTAVGAAPARMRVDLPLPDGGTLNMVGEWGVAARASQGRFSLTGARPAFWWPRLLPEAAVVPTSGRIDAQAHYSVALNGPLRDAAILEALKMEARALTLAPVSGGAPLLALDHASINGGRLLFGSRRLRLDGLRLESGQIGVRTEADGRLNWAGLTGPSRADGGPGWRIELADVTAEQLALRYEDMRVPVRADVVHLSARLQMDIATAPLRVSASAIDAVLGGARIRSGNGPPAGAAQLVLQGAHFDSAGRGLSTRRLDVEGLLLRLELDAGGRPRLPLAGDRPAAGDGATAGPAPRWNYRIDELAFNALTLQLAEACKAMAVLTLKGRAQVLALASGGKTPLTYSADLRSGDARLRLRGSAAPDASSADARVQVDAFPLDRTTPLLRRIAAVDLSAKRLDADLRLRHGGRPTLRAEGRTALSGLHLRDRASGETLLKASAVHARGRFDWRPDYLHLARLALEDAEGRIAIDASRQLNLHRLRDSGRSASPAAARDQAPRMPLRIDRLDVARGTLDFSDDSLVLPFSARIADLHARLLGIDNSPDGEATLEARGRVAPHGEARAEGRFRPSAPGEMTDLRVRFDNIDMPLLSPYSATFAGRKIASGKLWLDLRYRIRERELDGLNIATLQNVTLGERVREGGIKDSALEFALALLKDRDGRARVEVPVRGDLDDARILYRGVVADVLENTLQRIAGAPFRLLGRLVGREDALSGEVDFDPGSSRLTATETEKLDRLADALAQRPQLGLRLRPGFDAADDGRALRAAALSSEVTKLAALHTEGGLLDFGDPAVQRAVARLHAERVPAGRVQAREDGTPASYRARFDQLVDLQPVSADAVAELARRRADTARERLTARGVEATRIEVIAPVDARGDGARVDFELYGLAGEAH